MKKSAIVCAVLAGTFGITGVASAQDWRGHGDDRRHDRAEQRQERREARQERRDDRRDRQEQRVDRAWQQGYRAAQPRYVEPQRRYAVQQPSYVHTQPGYRSYTPHFYRGGYLPTQYRAHSYYVNDWNAYPGLYAPPYGHQWVQVGSDFLLVALATGLIANLLVN
ncbi:MAG TPA: RcnB family protein [Ramlibacter sp.]|uniref:RcnB family protein n=1 Tax=Ramlibacter sp. TaxID=1917967 RepID=UPI002ED095A7